MGDFAVVSSLEIPNNRRCVDKVRGVVGAKTTILIGGFL